MEDHVVDAVVAVDDRGLLLRRDVRRKPLDQRSIASIFSVSLAWYCLVQRPIWRAK
jgi:hypothetical protein